MSDNTEAETTEVAASEEVLVERDELLWRNAHPDWIVDGELTSQAFRPTPKDKKKLSSARAAKVSEEANFKEFTEDFGFESAGVWAVSVGEVQDQKLRSVYDEHSPATPTPCLKGHTSLDFTTVTSSQAKRIGGRLRDHAEGRGLRYPPA
ncbi:hypothetical protein R3P93_13295 [Rhodococcus cerastii]|uniref:Uncharacterized protein n=1 Tax=Rhodococcus cerastii TaxID=908616 RepID=A0ABU4D1F9_9NOCA|nr:hypothetical protein [Rhodococcus cerastii]MDV6303535.1 hypothetical protein [Rhodococcus cerastii]